MEGEGDGLEEERAVGEGDDVVEEKEVTLRRVGIGTRRSFVGWIWLYC